MWIGRVLKYSILQSNYLLQVGLSMRQGLQSIKKSKHTENISIKDFTLTGNISDRVFN